MCIVSYDKEIFVLYNYDTGLPGSRGDVGEVGGWQNGLKFSSVAEGVGCQQV